jgi:hypothetical protein
MVLAAASLTAHGPLSLAGFCLMLGTMIVTARGRWP